MNKIVSIKVPGFLKFRCFYIFNKGDKVIYKVENKMVIFELNKQ